MKYIVLSFFFCMSLATSEAQKFEIGVTTGVNIGTWQYFINGQITGINPSDNLNYSSFLHFGVLMNYCFDPHFQLIWGTGYQNRGSGKGTIGRVFPISKTNLFAQSLMIPLHLGYTPYRSIPISILAGFTTNLTDNYKLDYTIGFGNEGDNLIDITWDLGLSYNIAKRWQLYILYTESLLPISRIPVYIDHNGEYLSLRGKINLSTFQFGLYYKLLQK